MKSASPGPSSALCACSSASAYFGCLPKSGDHVDQADGLAGRREVDRADVQVLQLLRREQGEAAAAGRHHGDVVRHVVVRGDAGAVADPDAGQRVAAAKVEVVLLAKARQQLPRPTSSRRRPWPACPGRRLASISSSTPVEPGVHRLEVEAGQVVVVEEAPARVRRPQHRADGGVAVVGAQVGVAAALGGQRRAHHRPAAASPRSTSGRVDVRMSSVSSSWPTPAISRMALGMDVTFRPASRSCGRSACGSSTATPAPCRSRAGGRPGAAWRWHRRRARPACPR
jgi:hypothetical protein